MEFIIMFYKETVNCYIKHGKLFLKRNIQKHNFHFELLSGEGRWKLTDRNGSYSELLLYVTFNKFIFSFIILSLIIFLFFNETFAI